MKSTYVILPLELFHNQKSCGYAPDGCMYYNTNKCKKSKCNGNLITLGPHTKLFILELSN